MKLKTFHEGNKKKQMIIIGGIIVFILIAGILIYRTYAIYQEKQDFDVIKGNVPDQNYDVMISYEVKDEHGNINSTKVMPEGTHWAVDVSCNYGEGYFDYDQWNVVIQSKDTRTKCKLIFTPNRSPLKEYGIRDPLVESGEGLYEVRHNGVDITSPVGDYAKKGFSYTEYRYAGKDPNNYVLFNDELWRIIGLVNTPEGKRLKLIRSESIGEYSWDSSDSNVNNGEGVNEWSQSKLMKLLNPGYDLENNGGSLYWNKKAGNCYAGLGLNSVECDFQTIGLDSSAKQLVDEVTWNLGTHSSDGYYNITPIQWYSYERSNNIGKLCDYGNRCNDSIERTTTWKGYVGIAYLSDYGYATSGGDELTRKACLEMDNPEWRHNASCYQNDWLYTNTYYWLLTPSSIPNSVTTDSASLSFNFDPRGFAGYTLIYNTAEIRPTLHLKSNVKIVDGNGTQENPYQLSV